MKSVDFSWKLSISSPPSLRINAFQGSFKSEDNQFPDRNMKTRCYSICWFVGKSYPFKSSLSLLILDKEGFSPDSSLHRYAN